MKNKGTLLFLSQVYVPDPASVGQHMADAAAEMAGRGYRVVVITARRGYENPSVKYPARETRDGVEIRRVPLSSFGKASIFRRIVGAVGFSVQAIWHGLFTRGLKAIVFTTSPPLGAIPALALSKLRRVPLVFWVMDVNPDQYVLMHEGQKTSFKVKALGALNRKALAESGKVVALDRFMADRLKARCPDISSLDVMPPWPHADTAEPVDHEDNPFRRRFGLNGQLVVMYSGNHSPTNPLSTLVRLAERFMDDNRILFMFIGGGAGKKEIDDLVETHHPSNVLSLPYQPLDQLQYSLSAADVHVVTLGDPFVGVVHPCKIYGAMAVGRPILYFGPTPSHVTEIIEGRQAGWIVRHGDIEGGEKTLRQILKTDRTELRSMGETAQAVIKERFSKSILCSRFGEQVEAVLEA